MRGEASTSKPSPGSMGKHGGAAAPASLSRSAVADQLKELGIKLASAPPTPADALGKLLQGVQTPRVRRIAWKYGEEDGSLCQVAQCLYGIRFPGYSVMIGIGPILKATTREELLTHDDEDVKVLLAFCFCEITRITLPDVPYSDDVLRDICHLIVGAFRGLSDTNSQFFNWRVTMLETLERSRLCVVMLDFECNDLITDMFCTFFEVVSDNHEENMVKSMQIIMAHIIDGSVDLRESLLCVLLAALGWKKTGAAMSARKLARNVIAQSAEILEPYIKMFLTSSLAGSSSNDHIDRHGVICDLCLCAPKIHKVVVAYITEDLMADEADVRSKAVELLGELFSLPGVPISEYLKALFPEFLNRLTDTVADVCVCVVRNLKKFLISNNSHPEAPKIITALCDRLLDHEENVGKEVVAALCDVVCHSVGAIPVGTIKIVADHVHNKSYGVFLEKKQLSLKWYTMERLADIYKLYCMREPYESTNSDDFESIPGKILKCLYKDFRPESIESILCGSLFPPEFPTKERVKHWVTAVTHFGKVETKALEQILMQKQRLQQEMLKYMSLRSLSQEDASDPDLQKMILRCFKSMSHLFSDPANCEENLNMLHQLQDANVWKIFSSLLDCSTTFKKAWSLQVDLLNILGEKHVLYDFVSALAMRCSYSLVNKDYAKELLSEASEQKSAGNTTLVSSCMNLLTAISSFFPSLLYGLEEDITELLKDMKEDNAGNGDDVLGLVSEVNLDNQENLGYSESSRAKKRRMNIKENNNKPEEFSSPKRRSISKNRLHSARGSKNNDELLAHPPSTDETEMKGRDESTATEVLVLPIDSKTPLCKGNKVVKKSRNKVLNSGPKKSADVDSSKRTAELGSLNRSLRRQKPKLICSLAKCSMHKSSGTGLFFEGEGTGLLGKRIKVWWPLDKKFYEGLVQSYDTSKRKHTVLYDDGDIQALNLAKEKWEMMGSNDSSVKQQKKETPGTNQGRSMDSCPPGGFLNYLQNQFPPATHQPHPPNIPIAQQFPKEMKNVQRRISSKKLEVVKLAHLAAKEHKELKMLDTYKELLLANTSRLSAEAKAEHAIALKSMRLRLFGENV
ncbi:hypothetical protein ACP70R_047314 [Stipagrostis hirtigluma subsp. patula]